MQEAKSFKIPKMLIVEAYEKVKSNKGAAGIDKVTIEEFDKNLKSNLYKLWNRMSSGSYHPIPDNSWVYSKIGCKVLYLKSLQTSLPTLKSPNFEY